MAVGYQKTNFARGILASTLGAGASQLTMTAGHSLPTSGTFQLVIWDAATFPNPSDDSGVEIVTGVHNAGNVYDITRAQESTADVEHAAGEKVGLHYTAGVNTDDLDAANHPMARIAGSTYSTVQHMQDIFHSAGWISGGVITDDTDGTITVAIGTGLIRATDSAVAQILFTNWAAESGANVNLADNDTSWVYVEYNSGSPQVVATTTERTDFNTNILLASITRDGTTLHINQGDLHIVGDHANSMIRRLKETAAYGRVSGGVISETGTQNIAITAGAFWRGLTEFSTAAFDSSGADTFEYCYQDGGVGWTTIAAQSDINNTQWDDGDGGLATVSNNKYGVHWVYLEVDDHVKVLFGRGDYTLSQAEDATPPANVPEEVAVHGFLVGKIIIKKSDTTFTQIESAFETTFQGSLATAHSSLTELDFASAGHTGFQAQGDILDDLNTLGAAVSDGQFIVATGAGAFAYESTTTARTSLGVGEADSPQFAELTVSSASASNGFMGIRILDTNASDDGIARIFIQDGGRTISFEQVDQAYAGALSGVGDAREPLTANLTVSTSLNLRCTTAIKTYVGGGAAANIIGEWTTSGLSVTGAFEVIKESANAVLNVSCYHDTEATASIITLRKADGSLAAPALVDDNAVLGVIAFDGHDGSGFHTGAKIEARIDGTPSDGTDMPTELTFWTTPDASATAVERLVIKPDGGIFPAGMKSGTDQADASAAAGELYQDTNDDNTVKIGV